MFKHPILLILSLILLIIAGMIVACRELRFQNRKKEAENEQEKFKQSLGQLNRFLETNPHVNLDHPKVTKMAETELRLIGEWLESHPEQASQYLDHTNKLKRVIALSKPSP